MTRRFVIGVGVAALAVAVAGGVITAQGGGPMGPGGRRGLGGPGPSGPGGMGPGGPGGPGLLGPMLGPADLTDDQRDRVREILDANREEQEALFERARSARQALDASVNGGTFDESTVRRLAADVADVDADMAVARARIVADVFRILTPAQQDAIRKARTERQARVEQRLERMKENREKRRGQ